MEGDSDTNNYCYEKKCNIDIFNGFIIIILLVLWG